MAARLTLQGQCLRMLACLVTKEVNRGHPPACAPRAVPGDLLGRGRGSGGALSPQHLSIPLLNQRASAADASQAALHGPELHGPELPPAGAARCWR